MSSLGVHGGASGGGGSVDVATFPDNEPFNLAQYGGTNTTLGQKAMSASIPVTIASDQSNISAGQTDTEARAYQTATGTLSAAPNNVILSLNGASGASVNFIDSSWNGTVKFYSSCDGGTTYVETQAFNVYGNTGGATISNQWQGVGVAAFRIWNFVLVGGETHVKVEAVSGNSGSVAVTIKANDAAPSPSALAVCPNEEGDFGRPVGGQLIMVRSGSAGVRSPKMTSNRYEAPGLGSLVVIANTPTTNNLVIDTTVNDTNSSTTLLAQNLNRMQAYITNTSSAVLYVKLGSSAASATSFAVRLVQNATFEVPPSWVGQINGIWATDPNDGVAVIQEIALA